MPEPPKLPAVATQPLSVVLLAHNDAAHLRDVVAGWVTYLNGLNRDYEVILADAGSTDGTGELLGRLSEWFQRVRVVRGAGEGAALRAAFAEARHPLLFYTHCEPRYQPADLQRLLQNIDPVHLVSGYRAGGRAPLFWRLLGLLWRGFGRVVLSHQPPRLPGWLGFKSHAGRMAVRALFGVRYHDVACPFRLLRREILARIPLQSEGSFVHVEILAKANALGYYFGEEVPLSAPPAGAAKERPAEPFRQTLADARRVLRHPDFGPAVLPPDPVPK